MKGMVVGIWIETWKKILGSSVVGEAVSAGGIAQDHIFSPLEDVPEAVVDRMAKFLASKSSVSLEELWKKTGRANIQTFFRWYPMYFKKKGLLSFLSAMDMVHKILTRRIPGARPPRVFFETLDSFRAKIRYQSHRDLRFYFLGLVEGASEYFQDPVEIQVLGEGKTPENQNFLEITVKATKPYGQYVPLKGFRLLSLGLFKSFGQVSLFLFPLVLGLASYALFRWIPQKWLAAVLTGLASVLLLGGQVLDWKKGFSTVKSALQGFREKNLDSPVLVLDSSEFRGVTSDIAQAALSLRELMNSLAGDIQEIESFTGKIAESAAEMKGLIGTMGELSTQVAQSAVDISQDTESISEAVNSNVNTLRSIVDRESQMVESLNQAVNAILDSSRDVEQSANGIQKMSEGFDQLVHVGKDLQNQASKIMEIAETVTSISEQTNLLALNAAIEAARSGEAGRGFSVVADEIRKLAEESKSSSDQISQFLGSITSGINRLIERLFSEFEELKRQSENLRKNSNQNQQSSQNISDIALEINGLIKNLQEEASRLEGISSSIENLLAISEQSSATAEEISASIQKFLEDIRSILQNIEQIGSFLSNLNQDLGDIQM